MRESASAPGRSAKGEYTVVLRGPSALVFPNIESSGITIERLPAGTGPVNLRINTRYIDYGNGVVAPGNLWLDVRGGATSLDGAITEFANAALGVLPVLAVAGNAAIGDCEVEVAFASGPGVTQREYFQQYISPERSILHSARLMPNSEAVELLRLISLHGDAARILRGCTQYLLALRNWRLGRETLSTAHLWMAMEALTKARVRVEISKRGLANEPQLAAALGVEKLDPAVRKDLILNGDEECYSAAKKASDGFEHGFMDFEEMHANAGLIHRRLAAHIRGEIFSLAGLQGAARTKLTEPPYNEPMGHWPIVQYLRGHIIDGQHDNLGAGGAAYPFIKWNVIPQKGEPRPDGLPTIKPQVTLTPELGPGASFRPSRLEMWEA